MKNISCNTYIRPFGVFSPCTDYDLWHPQKCGESSWSGCRFLCSVQATRPSRARNDPLCLPSCQCSRFAAHIIQIFFEAKNWSIAICRTQWINVADDQLSYFYHSLCIGHLHDTINLLLLLPTTTVITIASSTTVSTQVLWDFRSFFW